MKDSLFKKTVLTRCLIYLIGLLVLAIGLSLATQVDLGVSPIISVAFTFSCISGWNFGNATFLWYGVLVAAEIVIHICKKKYRVIPMDLMQILLSLVFTRFLNVFKAIIPHFTNDLGGTVFGTLPLKLVFLLVSIICTGIGAALSLDMRLVPNPGDGIVQAVSDCIGKETGFCKNCVDISCVAISCLAGLLISGQIHGVNIGTLCAMILVGRVIAFINKRYLAKMKNLAGISA